MPHVMSIISFLMSIGSMSHVNFQKWLRGGVKIPTYKPHTNHKKPSVSSHTLAPTTICDLSHSVCGSPLTDLGHISSVTYVCHPLWFVCGHRTTILMSPLSPLSLFFSNLKMVKYCMLSLRNGRGHINNMFSHVDRVHIACQF